MPNRAQLIKEALRRGLIKRENIEAEAQRRGMSAYSPEQIQRNVSVAQQQRIEAEVGQFGRELTTKERLTRGAIKYGVPALAGIGAQLLAPEAPVIGGAIGVAGGTAEAELQLQRYDIRHGLRKKPVSLKEAGTSGLQAGGEALVTGGTVKGVGRMFGKLGGIPKGGSRYLEQEGTVGGVLPNPKAIAAAAIRPRERGEKRLLGRLRSEVGRQRAQLTPEKARMNAIVSEADAAGATVDPMPTIEALIGGRRPVTQIGKSGLRDATRTAENIISEVDPNGRIPIKRWNEITEELRDRSKYGALKIKGSDKAHTAASHAAAKTLESAVPRQYADEFSRLNVEVAAQQEARKFVQSKVGIPTKPKLSAHEFLKSVANDPEEMDWLRQFHPGLAKDVEYLSIRRLLKPDEKTRADEIMGVVRTLAMPVTRTVGKGLSMATKPATTAGGLYKPLKRIGVYREQEEK